MRARLGLALLAASLAGVGLFFVDALRNHNLNFVYLIWNLFLGWLPLVFALWLERILRRKLWSSWQAIGVTLLWLAFLPNSFYIITDYIHLQDYLRVDPVFDIIVFSEFILTGFTLGLLSLYLVHQQLRQRLRGRSSTWMLALVIFSTSFAIYIGRDLRWNTWDVLLNPASLLFDISDRLLHPWEHPEMFTSTLGFFVLISTMYAVAWHASHAAKRQPHVKLGE